MITHASLVATAEAVLALLLIVAPGILFFRLPVLDREFRAALAAEERWFWQILLAVVWSVSVALALGTMSAYSLPRLAALNAVLCALLILVGRGRLRWNGSVRRPGASVILPVALLAIGCWRFFPAAEYIIGGKDPGVYVNEGVSLARTGTVFRREVVVSSVPLATRELFFHDYPETEYYGLRFMGVFLNDPDTGEVISQLPHFFPASIALAYDIAGIRGATSSVVIWSLFGLLGVYFLGVRLAGRLPAFFATVLLTLNVIEVWTARYPNAEVVMQALVFAGLLALSYRLRDSDRFFGWVAAGLASALVFLRFDAYLAIAGCAAAVSLSWVTDRRAIGWGPTLLFAAASAASLVYYSGPMKAYFVIYHANLPPRMIGFSLVAIAIGAVLMAGRMRTMLGPWITRAAPPLMIATTLGLAVYALFFRHKHGLLADHDAFALRTFESAYVFWPALVLGLAGFSICVWKRFWREPAFFLCLFVFSCFFFYKIRVVPEQFWMARRFLPLVLPGLFLMTVTGAYGLADDDGRRKSWRVLMATAAIAFIGWQYGVAAAPVAAHVEYRGAIGQMEKLAGRTTDRDLLIFEGRGASDVHVLALPLSSAFGRNVLLLESELPDRRKMAAFLEDALRRYDRVLFVASGGTDFLSRSIVATPIAFTPVVLPEYATSAWNEYPSGPRQKDLSYDLYQLSIGTASENGFTLDVGTFDDLHVLRFQAREVSDSRTFRWTGPQSYVAVTGLAGSERDLTLVMHDGGRPAKAPPATVELFFNNVPLGTVHVESGFREYRVALPADVVKAASQSSDPAQLKLVSSTWTPSEFLGGTDTRPLGVMIDRVEIH